MRRLATLLVLLAPVTASGACTVDGVVSSHPEGVLKRLKGDDRRAVADWLAQNPPPAPAL